MHTRRGLGWGMRLGVALAAAALAIVVTPSRGQPQTPAKGAAKPQGLRGLNADDKPAGKTYALLIACTKYDNNKAFNLLGPANDVVLVREKLVAQFGFPAENIVTLSEAAAADKGPEFRPTRANIEREFKRLPARVKPGDQVVVLIGGHGSRQPEVTPDPNYPKPDGKDQIFLPADIGKWNGREKKVENAIVDYELRAWTKAITATGASLWVILDTCCSGSVMRSADDPENENSTVMREVQPKNLGIPEDKANGGGGVATRGGGAVESSRLQLDEQSPNYVGLYAAQPDQAEIECPLPDKGPNRKRYGLLTYTICEILDRAGGRALSYEELHAAIQRSYNDSARHAAPHPIIEGLARTRSVLGTKEVPRSSLRLVEATDDGWRLNAGKLFGLTEGSVLAVFAPPDQPNPDMRLGYVKVVTSDVVDSIVAPTEYAGQPAIDAALLKNGSRCEVVVTEFGSMKVPVAVDKRPPIDGEQIDLKLLGRLDDDLREASLQNGALFVPASDENPARWVVQQRGGKILLLPADAAEVGGPLRPEVPRFEIDPDNAAAELLTHLSRIARGQSLLEIAGAGGELPQGALRAASDAAVDAAAMDLEVVTMKLKDRQDQGVPFDLTDGTLEFKPGDYVAWKIVNHSRFKVDVTLLFVGSDYSIAAVFPLAGSGIDNQIPPGGSLLVGHSRINAKTLGREHLVVIAVKSQGQPMDFTSLVQPSLKAAKDKAISRGGSSPLDTPLGKLMQATLFDGAQSRGLDQDLSEESFRTGLISWKVQPPKIR